MKPNACPKPPQAPSTGKLDETLGRIGFAEGVREICQRAYADAASSGRPGIDPAVYFKMLMIGFFENLASERSIASRCADSLSLRKLVHRNTAHVLDQGGLRRTTLCGKSNLIKRQLAGGARVRPVAAHAQDDHLRHAQTTAGRSQ